MAALIVVEGIDGAGKSSAVAAAASLLRGRGLRVATFREPAILRVQIAAAGPLTPTEAAVLFAADRVLARPALRAALATHDVVITDRGVASSFVYQAFCPGGGTPDPGLVELIRAANADAPAPRATLVLDVPPATAAQRIATRAAGRTSRGGRFHSEATCGAPGPDEDAPAPPGAAAAYAMLGPLLEAAAADGAVGFVAHIDADAPPDVVAARLAAAVEDLLGGR